MAVISFSKDDPARIWCKAGWVFRQVLDDVLAQHLHDARLNAEFEKAKDVSGLMVDLMDSQLAAKTTDAIRDVVTRILSGEIRSGVHARKYGDPVTVMQYHRSLRELLDVIPPGGPE